MKIYIELTVVFVLFVGAILFIVRTLRKSQSTKYQRVTGKKQKQSSTPISTWSSLTAGEDPTL